MGFRLRLPWQFEADKGSPQAAVQSSSGGQIVVTPEDLERALRGEPTASGEVVNSETAMRVAAVYACNRLISGAVATLPLHIKRRVDHRTRQDADDHYLWKLLRRRPNNWQKPAQFRRMAQTHVNLQGNFYAIKVKSRGKLLALIPLQPGRMKVEQLDDLSLKYTYQRLDGSRVVFSQDEIFHLYGLTLNGFTGVTPLTYARETIGSALATERHGSNTFRNGAQVGGSFETAKQLGNAGRENIRAAMNEFRSQGEMAGKDLILEDGLTYKQTAMTSVDAQWIEARKFSRTDIAMFFGVPPHMIGDTEKTTSWGTGIEQQTQGFVAYTLEDHLTMWEEGVTNDLNEAPDIYAKFNRSALVKGDIKTRWEAHVKALQWGVKSPNEIRAIEDDNPRDDGDIYYDPPNTAGGEKKEKTDEQD